MMVKISFQGSDFRCVLVKWGISVSVWHY